MATTVRARRPVAPSSTASATARRLSAQAAARAARAGASAAAATATAVAVAVAPERVPERAPRPARPPLRVVRPQRRSRVGAIGAIATLVVFGVLFGLVLFQTVMVQNQARLDRLDSDIRDEQGRYQQLRLQVAQLEAPSRIVEVATTQLGMAPPPGTGYLTPSASDAAETRGVTSVATADSSNADAHPEDTGNDWPSVKPYLGAAR